MSRPLRTSLAVGTAAVLCILTAGCQPDYSPNTYASAATQQANKVNQGVVVGVRAVQISADTTLATTSGAAAGGVVGSGFGESTGNAAAAAAGAVAGGVLGNVVGHAQGDTDGFEYIVKKSNGDLLSVTQRDAKPLGIGAHVLLIEGTQARIVPDYTVPVVVQALYPEDVKPAPAKSEPAPAAAAAPPATQPAIVPSAVTPAPVPGTATTVIATPLPPPAAGPQTAAVNLTPAPEQKPAAAPEAGTPPAPKPEDAPKPAGGS
ncbi:MAG TPA: hypothetical protein VH722_12825 [Alphaproteobacteria bacterium]|nr:hypothetical protein [Alphaproteobacteria bacterium]